MPFLEWVADSTLNAELRSWIEMDTAPSRRMVELMLEIVEADNAATVREKQLEGISDWKTFMKNDFADTRKENWRYIKPPPLPEALMLEISPGVWSTVPDELDQAARAAWRPLWQRHDGTLDDQLLQAAARTIASLPARVLDLGSHSR